MSDIVGELALVQGAFDRPTLTLLHQSQAPVVLAIFRTAFSRDVVSVAADRLHVQVDAYLGELRQAGQATPTGSGRDLCMRWMNGQWLVRAADEAGAESYSLTSHAQEALTIVNNMTRDRFTLSEHRIQTIVTTAREFNARVNPDRAERVRILDAEIEERTRERDRLLEGGDLAPVSADQMLDGFINILSLIEALPGDFTRVSEAVAGMRRSIIADFRAEARPVRDILDDYLDKSDDLMASTPEGRAFDGAVDLLRNDALLLDLKSNLNALLAHPLSDNIVMDSDRRDVRAAVSIIRKGMSDVLSQRSRLSATLREQIVSHDIARDIELDATLRALNGALETWMSKARVRDVVPLALLPEKVNVATLRERFHDPSDDQPLEPLVEHEPGDFSVLTIEQIRQQGGPSLNAMREAIIEAAADPDPGASLGRFFESLEPAMRRPVEILGLLHLAAEAGVLDEDPLDPGVLSEEVFRSVRPDGTSVDFVAPRVALSTHIGERLAPEDLPDLEPRTTAIKEPHV